MMIAIKTIEQNIRQTKEAIDVLKSINPAILIEGEIGDIGTGSQIHDVAPDLSKGLTAPEQAKQYVAATGVDILAPAVGNMHGMVASMIEGKTKKRLDIVRIAQIKTATGSLMTLHGASGTDDEDLRKAIAAGINVASPGNAESRPPQICHLDRTRISCHAALDIAACAAFVKESSIKCANATKFYRKSGGA
jgi:fructose/tagatose bisphosphate aldolase